jgi:predicted dehydrogenase
MKPDAVILATPPATHADLARVCLEAGCHALMEKPICPDPAQARELAKAFRRRGRVLFGGHSERFHPVFLALMAQMAKSPGWKALRCHRLGPPPTAIPEGGAVLDLAIHDLDLALRLAGPLEVEEVRRDDLGLTEALLAGSDRRVSITVGYQGAKRRTWELETEDGIWHADFLAATLELRSRSGSIRKVEISGRDALEREHEAFREAIEGADWWEDLQPQIRAVELAREILSLP